VGGRHVLIFDKNGLGYILGDFSQTHLATLTGTRAHLTGTRVWPADASKRVKQLSVLAASRVTRCFLEKKLLPKIVQNVEMPLFVKFNIPGTVCVCTLKAEMFHVF
jgi:hypothetical protein